MQYKALNDQTNLTSHLPQTDTGGPKAFSLVEIWEYLKQNWIWIALGLILSLLIAHIYLRYSENFYQAEAKILLKEDATKGSSELSLITGKMGKDTKPNISDQIEIMKSRRLIQKVVDKLNLNIRYFSDGRVKKGEIFH